MIFHVTTATTTYETYRVQADSEEAAKNAAIIMPEMFESWADGEGDDTEIINVKQVDDE